MFSFRRNTYRNSTDEELIAIFRENGSTQVLGVLYERYGHLVMGTCMKYLKNQMDAEDVVMKIFEELGQKLMRFEISYFKSWLYQLTRNECLMILRKKNIEVSNDLLIQLQEESNELVELNEKETKLILVEGKIKELKDEQRKCLELFYLEERSYEQIALILSIDIKQVKSAIQNGKRNLKLKLEEHHEFKTKT
jgi:RNA polymerase sigma factor (sigma-70 family)